MGRYYRPGFRSADVSQIITGIDRGQCVSVIGAPSIGKTNLLRYIDQGKMAPKEANEDPWRLYSQNAGEEGPVYVVNIDPNALVPALPLARGDIAARSWPGFELMIHRATVTPGLCPIYYGPALPENDPLREQMARHQSLFENAHLEVTSFDDDLHAHLAIRHLESIINASLAGHEVLNNRIRIAFFFDEFERLLDTMPDFFFVALRSIRDRFKYQVMYVTFTRNNLSIIAGARRRMLESFLELFHDHWIYLPPYNDDDAFDAISRLQRQRRDISPNDYPLGLMIRATGGFAGLIRASYMHEDKLAHVSAREYSQAILKAAEILCQQHNVIEECETLLRALDAQEIKVMYDTVEGRVDQKNPVFKELCNKWLIKQVPGHPPVIMLPPILAEYIRTHPTPPEPEVPVRPPTLPEL